MNERIKEESGGLKESVFSRIEKEGVTQTARVVFVAKNGLFWILWTSGTIIGAASFAAMIFAGEHIGWEFYEATHRNIWTFFMIMLPYLWIVVLLATILFGYFNLRHTKTGYRYSLRMLVVISVGTSVCGGVALYYAGAGAFIEYTIGNYLPFNHSVVSLQRDMWTDPENGRLIGVVQNSDSDDRLSFVDARGEEWTLITEVLRDRDRELLESDDEVRLLGYLATSSGSGNIFYVCLVIPGTMSKGSAPDDVFARRTEFMTRVSTVGTDEINGEIVRSNNCESVRPRRLIPR